jgi:hypothetical protein
MGWYSSFQIFRPQGQLDKTTGNLGRGLLNYSGTPSLLADMSSVLYQAQWTDLMQGGLDKANFDCRLTYEGTTLLPNGTSVSFLDETLAGNWVLFGCLGAALDVNANSGAGSLTITDLQNQQLPAFHDLIAGDLIVVTDGVNSELFKVGSISGHGPTWTLNLASAWSNVQIAQQTYITNQAAQGASQIIVKSGAAFSANKKFVLGADQYQVSGGYGGGTTIPISNTGGLISNYSINTPISFAAVGANSIKVSTSNGVPDGPIWIDSGSDKVGESVTVSSKPDPGTLELSGSGLQNAHGAGAPVIFEMPATLQNGYQAGQCIIARVQYSGYISQRIHNTVRPDQFSVLTEGFFNRYNFLVDSSTIQNEDAATQMRYALASYAGSFGPNAIIVNNSTSDTYLASANAIPINVQETDVQFSEFLDTILRQENGNSDYVQYAVWVGPDRQVRHLPIATNPAYTSGGGAFGPKTPQGPVSTPTYYLTLSDQSFGAQSPSYGDTIDSVQMTDEDTTNLMNSAVVTGTTSPDGSEVYNENTTTLSQDYTNGFGTANVTQVPSSWVTGSGLYFLIDRKQLTIDSNCVSDGWAGNQLRLGANAGGHGTGWYNPDSGGYNVGDDVEMVTKLLGAHNPGAQSFAVGNAGIFSSGQEVTLTPTGTSETLTIESIDYNTNVITTTTACKKNHSAGDIVCLSANGSGSGPLILVEVAKSINALGWFEGTLSSEDIYDETALKNWAGKQLAMLAFPALQAQVMLSTTAARITGRDLVSITGFTDGTSIIQNVQSIQYNMTAADMNISATLNLGNMRPTGASFVRNIAKERSKRLRYHIPRHHSNKNGMMHGHALNQTGPNEITIDAGTISYNGQIIQIPAMTTVVPDGESRWGAAAVSPDIWGSGDWGDSEVWENQFSATIVELPKRYWNGRSVYSHGGVYVIDEPGDVPQKVDGFLGVPLWKVNSKDGGLVGWEPLFEQRGVGLENMPSSTPPAAPIVTGFTQASNAQYNGIACDLSLSGTITNFPTDGATQEIKFYLNTVGTTNIWSHKHTLRATGLPQPSTSQPFGIVINGVPNGTLINVAISVDGFNAESPMSVMATGTAMPSSAPAIGAIGGPTITSGVGAPTGTPTKGSIYLRTDSSGTGTSLYVYDGSVWSAVPGV